MEEAAKKKDSKFISVVGRRKEAVARVRIMAGTGQLTVNGKPVVEYFSGAIFQRKYLKPLEITKASGKYTISAKVEGGGRVSQLEAVVHGIARALSKQDPALRVILKREGLLTRDARVKERRKFGLAGKARAKKQSPKR